MTNITQETYNGLDPEKQANYEIQTDGTYKEKKGKASASSSTSTMSSLLSEMKNIKEKSEDFWKFRFLKK